MLAVNRYLADGDGLATVFKAFHGAKAAVHKEKQLAHARGIGPIGMPVYAFIDPQDELATPVTRPRPERLRRGRAAPPDR